jgi:hypothetical protein
MAWAWRPARATAAVIGGALVVATVALFAGLLDLNLDGDVTGVLSRWRGIDSWPHAIADAAVCAADEMPPPVIDARLPWTISLHNVSRAASFPELRWLLSGRPPHAVPAALADALATYSTLHRDMMAGRVPLRVWIMRGCGAGVVCGGIGECLKAVRMALYVALLSRLAR